MFMWRSFASEATIMNSPTYLFLALAAVLCVFSVNGFATENNSRRSFLQKSVAVPSFLIASQLPANAASTKDLVNDLVTSKTKMEVIPDLLQQNEWDKVRTILKTPPVNSLWNLGDSQNPLVKLAKETGEFELLELKDELAISLQICDQLTYDNAFVYFQPGNGKVNIKEPTSLANKAMSQIGDAISLAGGN